MLKWLPYLGLLVGCHTCHNELKIAASPIPHAEILQVIGDELKQEGICLKIIAIDDYALPNRLLSEKQVDANFFQHIPFLEEQIRQMGYQFEILTPVHAEPLGIYSKKIIDLTSIPCGATIAIPSDATNESRALKLLEQEQLIKLKESSDCNHTKYDIIDNPYRLKIEEIDAAYLPRTLNDVAAAVIPANFALQAGLLPQINALAQEADPSSYANVVVIHQGDHREELLCLKSLLTSEKVKQFILKKYQGALIPAFN